MKPCFILILAGVLVGSPVSAQWVRTNGPYSGCIVNSLAVSGASIFAGTSGGVYLSTNSGANWTAVNTGLTITNVYTLAVSGATLFAGAGSKGIFLSTNNGTSWAATTSGLTASTVMDLAVSGTNVFAGTDSGVFLSTNRGASWTRVNNGLTSLVVTSVAASGTTIYAGTWGKSVFYSTNNGTSWIQTASVPGPYVWSLRAFGTYVFWGMTEGYVRFSPNYAAGEWQVVQLPSSSTAVNTFAFSGTNVFAGTDGDGVFLSPAEAKSWTRVNDGLTSTQVYSLTVIGTYLYAGTADGVFRRPLSEMVTSVGGSVGEVPASIALEQNYPNPFNPKTTIRYAFPHESFVSLKVFNVLGEEVAALVQGTRPTGVYTVQFDASNMVSGIYFYRLQAGEYLATKRMVLLK